MIIIFHFFCSSFCPDGHAFCKGNGLCQEEGKPCCSQGRHGVKSCKICVSAMVKTSDYTHVVSNYCIVLQKTGLLPYSKVVQNEYCNII